MNEINLDGMSRDELTDLLQRVMIRLRQVEAEEIKNQFITKSQRLLMEETVNNHLNQGAQK